MSTAPHIDPRGPRFGAAITTVVLATTLLLGPVWGLIPLGVQTLAFALGAVGGLHLQPYGVIYKTAVRPRLKAPAELEDPRPPRFAQVVGLVFALAAVAGSLLVLGDLAGFAWLFYIAVAFALIAAFLNAAFDFCLGCEVWVLIQRLRGAALEPRRIPTT